MLSGARGLLRLRPIMLGGYDHHLPRPQGGQCLSAAESPRACLNEDPGFTLGRGRWDWQTGGRIMPARSYHTVGKVKVWITPGISSFRLVAPPLQPRVVGLSPVWGVGFPICLPLEGTGHIQIFGLSPATCGTHGTRPRQTITIILSV
jgi:hypothetical protein